MIKSMTGYGRERRLAGKRDITVEVRSVNHRYFECAVKMPRIYSFMEEAIKTRVLGSISRGKIDVYLTIDSSNADNALVILNKPMLEGYLSALSQMKEMYALRDDVSAAQIARFPDVFIVSREEPDTEVLTADVLGVLDSALAEYTKMREREGAKLCEDIEGRLCAIEGLVAAVEQRSPQTVAEYRARLEQKLKELLANADIDESRILTEAAIFADRVAVNEETVRLKSHLSQLSEMLRMGGAIGRKLDFLVQELNREANTIGSKANDVEIARYVVDIKAEIEKIKEQAQNIE